MGYEPFPSRSGRTHYSQDLLDNFDELNGTEVTVAGRIVSLREHGALTFAHSQDQAGRIQLYIKRSEMKEPDAISGNLGYANLGLLDVGDFVEAGGIVTTTKKGERSVDVRTIRMLAKSLRPLPEKWAGIKDRETILRRRYLDTTMFPVHKEPFAKVSAILFAARDFLRSRGFSEFQTPVLQPQYGGGTAKPFTTHLNALGIDVYLAISHELYLKRLIAAGFDRVFTIGRYFRNEGIDSTHHPEFSMIETMTAYENYEFNMDLVEDLFRYVATNVYGRTQFTVGGHLVDFAPRWVRVSMVDAVRNVTGVDFASEMSIAEANGALRAIGFHEDVETVGHALVSMFEHAVQPTLIQPTLVFGQPVEISPLSKAMASDARYAERFEIFVAGIECGDNWTEQNDPLVLFERWQSLQRQRVENQQPIDYDFLEVLEHGMPPTTGIGPGIERMAMIFNETQNIDDVIFFPLMRPAMSDANVAIYGERAHKSTDVLTEIALDVDELESLLADGVMRVSSQPVTVELKLKIWNVPGRQGWWRGSGFLRLAGFLEDRDLIVTGYQIKGGEQLHRDEEAKRFREHVEMFVKDRLRPHGPARHFHVAHAVQIDVS
ncbi:MAG: lysine--tRNA ligase [Acidobacteriota bacterium]|nr:lysine--tRNA ligase [Acidobacteriota bacterium]